MDRPDSVPTGFTKSTPTATNPVGPGTSQQQQPAADTTTPNSSPSDSPTKNSKRPKNTALKQQRLPAWQPILTAKTVLPLFFSIGVVFVVLGSVLLHYSNIVNEHVIDYTDCLSDADNRTACSQASNATTRCTCVLNFQLTSNFQSPVYLYYGLKNFYQNHRRYVKSRDDNQLLGESLTSVSSECAPYDYAANRSIYAPCGAIANSLFNDSFEVSYYSGSTKVGLGLIRTGIAWTSDKNVKFNNPSSWANTVKPVNWQKDVTQLDPQDPSNNGYKNEDLIVWMRTAALPTFRKFYRRVDHVGMFSDQLPAGYYSVKVDYNFPVTVFNGRKYFVISTTTWIGGKNPFLGIAYLVVGCLCITLGFVFLFIHFKFARNAKPSDDFVTTRPNVSTIDPNRT